MNVAYRIGAVSRLTGLSTDTLRAWERRYEAVKPGRGKRDRDYGQAEVDRLILLRRVVERGHAIRTVARLPDDDLRELLGRPGEAASGAYPLIAPLLEALENFDAAGITEHLGRIAVVLPPSETVHQVVLPAMKEAGERWHAGHLSVAQIFLLSNLIQNLLGTLMGLYRPEPGAQRLIFAAPSGESHTVGILAAAMLAAGAGLSPIYLGGGVPAKEMIHAARRSGARAVVLQVGGSELSPADAVRELLEGLPSGVELWLGGKVNFPHEGAVLLEDFPVLDHHYRRIRAGA